MFSKNKQRIEEQRRLLELAAERIEQLQNQLEAEQGRAAGFRGGGAYILSQLEGAWELPVRWAEGPPGFDAVVTTEASPDAPGLEPLTVMALQSAFPNRARLEDLKQSGWALVRAWPLNSPQGLESLPGYKTDSYVLCALTSSGLHQAGRHNEAPARQESRRGFETRI